MILSSASALLQPVKRIVSVVPSQTELLHYLGLEEEIAGITKFCIHPDTWFRNKIRVGGTKSIDIQKIIDLQPDCIIANKEENIKEQIEELAVYFPVLVTDVKDLETALHMITGIGRITQKTAGAGELVNEIKNRFDRLPAPASPIPAAYLIWKDPYMTTGSDTFIHDMMQKAGFQNVFANRQRYPEISVTDIQNSNCKLLLLSSEPFPFKQKHIDELQEELPGVTIRLVDGEMFSWYGSRLLQAPAYFEELLQHIPYA